MLIKHSDLPQINKPLDYALYILCGENPLRWDETVDTLKTKLNLTVQRLDLESDADWQALVHQLNCHHLFSDQELIDAHWNKKTLEKCKPLLTRYLEKTTFPTLLLLQTPLIPAKQWQWLANHARTLIIQCTPDTPNQLLIWAHQQFKKHALAYDANVPERLLQYTHGNPRAMSQAISRLLDSGLPNITHADLEQQLIDECNYGPFELTDACLNGDLGKAIHVLRQAYKQGTELTLLLGIFSRFIRQCIESGFLLKNNAPQTDYQKHGIWPKHIALYKKILGKTSLDQLNQLLVQAQQLDISLKSQPVQVSLRAFEQLILTQIHILQ